jgi:small subunit ribosomal protein S5
VSNFQPRPKGAKGPVSKSAKPGDSPAAAGDDRSSRRGGRDSNRSGNDRQGRDGGESEWLEKVIQIRRVTKVVKGGKNMSFSALVVVGDLKGHIGVGLGKAAEVVDAIRKAIEKAKRTLIRMPFDQGSIPHNVEGHFGSTRLTLLKAPKGTGLIACWSVKMALESAGLHNVVCKATGSTNPINIMGALEDAISNMRTKGQVKQLRGGIKSSVIHSDIHSQEIPLAV